MVLFRVAFLIARGPMSTLIDPRAQQADFSGGEAVAFFWHDHVLIESGHEMDERALSAFARMDIGRVFVAALERALRSFAGTSA